MRKISGMLKGEIIQSYFVLLRLTFGIRSKIENKLISALSLYIEESLRNRL